MSDEENNKITCKYGNTCYQKNPEHLAKYNHPKKRSHSPEHQSNKKPKQTDSLIEEDNVTKEKKVDVEFAKKLIKKYFLVDMPSDFYDFWQFCAEYCKDKPKNALKALDLVLVGPFDVLPGTQKEVANENHLLHCRYYFDPPEFQTIIKGAERFDHHIGYFRDSPEEQPCFVAENYAKNDCLIKPMGANIFAAVNTYVENLLPKTNPFKKMDMLKIQKALKERAKELKYDLSKKSLSMEKRSKLTVCKSFHSAGIVVPYNKKSTIGYRPLSVSDKELVKICDRVAKSSAENRSKTLSELQPVITAATIAVDECDFGTALELGIDLFCYGNEHLDSSALRLLTSVYSVLERDAFGQIAEIHLKNRKRGITHVVDYS